jgi:uncharacterized protein YegP (UPF0339 family)
MARYFEIDFTSNGQLMFNLGASHRKVVVAGKQVATKVDPQVQSASLKKPARTGDN